MKKVIIITVALWVVICLALKLPYSWILSGVIIITGAFLLWIAVTNKGLEDGIKRIVAEHPEGLKQVPSWIWERSRGLRDLREKYKYLLYSNPA